jgi:hypothetical protein
MPLLPKAAAEITLLWVGGAKGNILKRDLPAEGCSRRCYRHWHLFHTELWNLNQSSKKK